MTTHGVQDQAIDPAALSLPAGAALRGYIAARLDPLEVRSAAPPFRSDLDLNPDMVSPALAEGYKPAAVLIGLAARENGPNVLLTRRADDLRRHAGQIAFPGGRSEAGEQAWQTALREAEEEIGLAAHQVELIGLSTPFRLGSGYDVTPVVGLVAPDFRPASNPAEVAEVFEAPFAFLMDPANYELRLREQPGPPRWHYVVTYRDHVIWGATAAMLRALSDRLQEAPRG
jgi:8-oxo-dGTP pyrophosphatase MutT (NUDIX family)